MRKFLLIPGLLVVSAAFLGCGGSEEGGGTNATGAKVGVDTSYVLPEAVAALVVHPQQLLKSPTLADNADVKKGLEKAKTELGVDPESLEQIVISGGPPGDDPTEKPVTYVFRFSSPHSGKVMVEKAAKENNPQAEIEEVSFNSKTYYREKPATAEGSKPEVCAYFPDDKTAVLAEEGPLKRVMDAKEAVKTPLTEALTKVDASGDVVVVLVMNDKLREMAKSSGAPKAGNAFDNLPENLNQVVLSSSLSPKIQVDATLTLKDEQAAGDIDAAIKQSIQDGLTYFDNQLKELEKTPADDQFAQFAEMEKKTFQELKKMLNGVSSETSGAQVHIQVAGLDDVDYKSLMEGPMGMMAGMMLGDFGAPSGPPGGDFGPPDESFNPPDASFDPPDEGPGQPVDEPKEAEEVEVEVEAADDDGN